MAGHQKSRRLEGIEEVSNLKPIIRHPKAAEDLEGHAMYIADGSIDAALRFLERAEQTIKGLSLFPASGAPFLSRHSELAGVRTKSVKDFPNHIVFYIERDHAIEIIRVLSGGQDLNSEIQKA